VLKTGVDLCNAGDIWLNGRKSVGRRRVTDLSQEILSPGANRAVRKQGEVVIFAPVNRYYIRQTGNLRGKGARRIARTVAKLPEFVTTPRPDRAVGFERDAVIDAAPDGDDASQRHRSRRVRLDRISG
jgi:hypothetical protein